MNLRKLADDIIRSRKDEHFKNYLLKAEELFAEEIEKAKVLHFERRLSNVNELTKYDK